MEKRKKAQSEASGKSAEGVTDYGISLKADFMKRAETVSFPVREGNQVKWNKVKLHQADDRLNIWTQVYSFEARKVISVLQKMLPVLYQYYGRVSQVRIVSRNAIGEKRFGAYAHEGEFLTLR